MMKVFLRILAVTALAAATLAAPAFAAGEKKKNKDAEFSFQGPLGMFDRAALQRGFKVYQQVCATCHGMEQLDYRHLGQKGGPFYDAAYPNPNDNPVVKAIAAEYEVTDGVDDYGDPKTRDGLPKDDFYSPFPNEQAARVANGGAYPVDLSLITKARFDGPNYVYSLLTGYGEDPHLEEGEEEPIGLYYNPWFEGGWIGMPQPLYEGSVSYDDGTEATVDQMAEDVATFLHWAAEPKLEQRKAMGFVVLGYLSVLTILLYAAYRRVWRNVKH